MQPTQPNEEERQQELDQDNQTPFTPADPNPASTGNTTDPVVQSAQSNDLPDDHPATDTNVQPEEAYDESISGAAEVEDTSGQSAVTGYTPPEDTDETDDIAL